MTFTPTLCNAAKQEVDPAFTAVCRQRKNWPADNDIWSLRAAWPQIKAVIVDQLNVDQLNVDQLDNGTYRFALQARVTKPSREISGETIDLWSARDAVVLKALATALAGILPVSARCTHVKDHGGHKGAVAQVAAALPKHRFVMRTDVKSYYASVDHGHLLDRLKRHITDARILGLLRQYLARTTESGGVFTTFDKGLSPRCALSPLMGAFFLGDLDARLEQRAARDGLFYIRYMDDILVLAPQKLGARWAAAARRCDRSMRSWRRSAWNSIPTKHLLGAYRPPPKGASTSLALGAHFSAGDVSRTSAGPVTVTLATTSVAKFHQKLSRLARTPHPGTPGGGVRGKNNQIRKALVGVGKGSDGL